MNLREEFRRLADECRQTARLAKDPVDRARWESLAERFDHSSRPPTGPFAGGREREQRADRAETVRSGL
jgi:hypothetical protein